MLNIKAVCAFASLCGLNVIASNYEGQKELSYRNGKTYSATDREIAVLRDFLKENLNNASYSNAERAAIIKRADTHLAKNGEHEHSSSSSDEEQYSCLKILKK